MAKKNELGSNIPTEDHDIAEVIESNKLLAEQNRELQERLEALTRESNTPLVNKPKAGERPMFSRVKIILEESDQIAPSGQYFGIHGTWVNPSHAGSVGSRCAVQAADTQAGARAGYRDRHV